MGGKKKISKVVGALKILQEILICCAKFENHSKSHWDYLLKLRFPQIKIEFTLNDDISF